MKESTFKIGDRTYIFEPMGARRLHRLKIRLGKHLLKVIGSSFSDDLVKENADEENILEKIDLANALNSLSETLSNEEIEYLQDEILSTVFVQTATGGSMLSAVDNFDAIFAGKYFADIEKVTIEAFKEAFKNFKLGSFVNGISLLGKAKNPAI